MIDEEDDDDLYDDLYDRDPDDPDDRGEEEEVWDDEQFAGPSRSEIIATRVLRRRGVRFWDDRAIDAFGDLVRRLDEQRSDLLALRLPGESRLLLPPKQTTTSHSEGTNPASRARMTPQEFAADSNWRWALKHNPQGFTPSKTEGFEGSIDPFTFDDIVEVIACVEGEGDGPDWLAAVRLQDNRLIFIVAGCDYTGWDCQSDMRSVAAATLPELIRWGMSEEQRERLGFTLDETA